MQVMRNYVRAMAAAATPWVQRSVISAWATEARRARQFRTADPSYLAPATVFRRMYDRQEIAHLHLCLLGWARAVGTRAGTAGAAPVATHAMHQAQQLGLALLAARAEVLFHISRGAVFHAWSRAVLCAAFVHAAAVARAEKALARQPVVVRSVATNTAEDITIGGSCSSSLHEGRQCPSASGPPSRAQQLVARHEAPRRSTNMQAGAEAALSRLQAVTLLSSYLYAWSRTAGELHRREELETRLQVAAFEERGHATAFRLRAAKCASRLVDRHASALRRLLFGAWHRAIERGSISAIPSGRSATHLGYG